MTLILEEEEEEDVESGGIRRGGGFVMDLIEGRRIGTRRRRRSWSQPIPNGFL